MTKIEDKEGQERSNLRRRGAAEAVDEAVITVDEAGDLRFSGQALRLLFDRMPAVVWTVDADLRFTSSFGAGIAPLDLTPDQVRGLSLFEYFGTDDDQLAPIAAHRQALTGEAVDYEVDWDGRAFDCHLEPLRNRHGVVSGVIGVARDTSDRRRAEDKTRQALSLLTATLESTADGLLVVDTDGRISSFNQKFLEMWHLKETDLHSGKDEQALALVLDQLEDPEGFLDRVQSLYHQPGIDSFDVLHFKDGRVFERFSHPQRIDGEVVGRVWSFRDATERRRAEERIQHQAFHDALTGIPNRQLVRDRLEVALASARRQQKAVGVLFLDLDSFKLVNDTFGHSVGDELLQAVAERLKAELREGDTLGRLGGDEFTLVLNDLRRADDAVAMAKRVRSTFLEPFVLSSTTVPMTASIGISFSPMAGEDVEFLLQSADAAMYVAKGSGGNAWKLATADLNLRTWRRASLVNRLSRALENEELEVHYQPIVALGGREVVGAEALLRWRDPEEGLIEPADFLPIAEETQLIVPISRWVLEQACSDAVGWQQLRPGMRVAVNLSQRQFQRPGLRRSVTRTLTATTLEPHLLELEFAESIALQNAERAIDILTSLRELGIRIAIDDFGAGQTSLSYLQRLPMDALKVDRALVRDVTESDQAAVIVSSILEMAHGLGLDTVAEGVETEAQQDFLMRQNCIRAQGFLYGKPMPLNDFSSWLASD